MSLKIVVLAKQVPDTRNVGKEAMRTDGTINRGALAAVFNPEDLNALEMALSIKDLCNAEVHVLTMGPPRAAEIVREAIFRGADSGTVISDSRFAGSDTLATSYALSMAIKKLGAVDLVLCGRQAIDGDTAQVGPQVAEKLNIPQITYAEEALEVTPNAIVVKRRLENGVEVVKTTLPALITVQSSAKSCRFRNALRVMKYKYATSLHEGKFDNVSTIFKSKDYLQIIEWNAEDINANPQRLGLQGSPTKVKNIESMVLAQKESQMLSNSDEDLMTLTKDLMDTHILS